MDGTWGGEGNRSEENRSEERGVRKLGNRRWELGDGS